MGIVVMGAVFVDIKGFPDGVYVPEGRNAGHVEYIHGGVSRNVVEDIANMELRPTFLGIVDNSALGEDVIHKLQNHKVDTQYMKKVDNGMGTWLAVFDQNGDLAGSISQRPDLSTVLDILNEQGDRIFSECDSVVIEIDMDKEILKKTVQLAEQYNKKLFGVVSNMNIALERRDFLQKFECLICNKLEAGLFFAEDYEALSAEELLPVIVENVDRGKMQSMIVTMGGEGAVYASKTGENGICPAQKVVLKDSTGAGDAFCAGASAALTYGNSIKQACEIGSRLAASVITSSANVCPRFLPEELGIQVSLDS